MAEKTKASDVTKNAKKMISDGYVYVYGYKGSKVTKDGVESLARQYPSVFTSTIKNLALKKVGKTGIDCSGFVNKAAKTSLGGSSQIRECFLKEYKISNSKYAMDGMAIWRNGHIGTIEVDVNGNAYILEAQSTATDLKRTSWDSRASHFTVFGKLPGVNYNTANIKGVGKVIGTYSIKDDCTMYKKCDVKSGKYRKFEKGVKIRVIEDMKNGWSKIWYSGDLGYVKNSCINKVGLSTYPKTKVTIQAALRKSNKSTSEKLDTIKVGTEVKVICKRKYWTNVLIGTHRGWIATKKLKF